MIREKKFMCLDCESVKNGELNRRDFLVGATAAAAAASRYRMVGMIVEFVFFPSLVITVLPMFLSRIMDVSPHNVKAQWRGLSVSAAAPC